MTLIELRAAIEVVGFVFEALGVCVIALGSLLASPEALKYPSRDRRYLIFAA